MQKYEESLWYVLDHMAHIHVNCDEETKLKIEQSFRNLNELLCIYKLMKVEMTELLEHNRSLEEKARKRGFVYESGFYQGKADAYRDLLDYWNEEFLKENLKNFLERRGIC